MAKPNTHKDQFETDLKKVRENALSDIQEEPEARKGNKRKLSVSNDPNRFKSEEDRLRKKPMTK